jgi:hypothetical protein
MARGKLGERSEFIDSVIEAQRFPRYFDSQREDGGVNLLVSKPGGRIVWSTGPNGPEIDYLPLLVQRPDEHTEDFTFRSSLAELANIGWGCAANIAGRPFARGIVDVKGAKNVYPSESFGTLADGGTITFCKTHSTQAVGYGFPGLARVRDNGTWQWINIESVNHIEYGSDMAISELEVYMDVDGDTEIWEYVSVVQNESSFEWRAYALNDNGEPEEEPFASRNVRFIPFAIWYCGEPGRFISPILSAFRQEWIFTNVSSMANTGGEANLLQSTFFSGLQPNEIENFSVRGIGYVYPAQSPDADAKVLGANAPSILAGIDMVERLRRSAEVAGLSPMLTRHAGNAELATALISTERSAVTVAEVLGYQIADNIARTIALSSATLSSSRSVPRVVVKLHHDYGLRTESIDYLRMVNAEWAAGNISTETKVAQWIARGLVSDESEREGLVKDMESGGVRIDKRASDVESAEAITRALRELSEVDDQNLRELALSSYRKLGFFVEHGP